MSDFSESGPSPDVALHTLGPRKQDRDDWRWQARHAATTLEGLTRVLTLTGPEKEGVNHALNHGFPLSVTPYYLGLCDPIDPSCPIRQQCVPRIEESQETEGDLRDPLGEEAHEVAPHLVRRYPDRALLLVTDRCGVYCRFCTRSRMVGQGGGARSDDALSDAFAYLEQHPEVVDVIVSGGDPGLLATARITRIMSRLKSIGSVRYVRFATRVPVTLPQRVDEDFARALRTHPATFLMTHFNHPKELTAESRRAAAVLADNGVVVLNQSVLLRGINDDAATLTSLFRGLLEMRVRPYYLLQADPVRGTGHLRTPLSTGIEIMEKLQGRVSGIALPRFIVDTPGGRGKVWVGPETIVSSKKGVTRLKTFRGEIVEYIDPGPPKPSV